MQCDHLDEGLNRSQDEMLRVLETEVPLQNMPAKPTGC